MVKWSCAAAVLLGALVAGALDVAFAISFAAYNGVGPVRVLQTVASGLLGAAAFSGGIAAAVLGLALHFGLSLLWASFFLGLALLAPLLVRRWFATGVGFGIAVFLAMRLVVLPLSAFPYAVTFKPLGIALDLLSHMFFFGVPIVFAVRKALGRSGQVGGVGSQRLTDGSVNGGTPPPSGSCRTS